MDVEDHFSDHFSEHLSEEPGVVEPPPPDGCLRCGIVSARYFALASAGGLEQVCEHCYLVGTIQNLLKDVHQPESRAIILPDLRDIVQYLVTIGVSRRQQ